jgi:hypothetical protein
VSGEGYLSVANRCTSVVRSNEEPTEGPYFGLRPATGRNPAERILGTLEIERTAAVRAKRIDYAGQLTIAPSCAPPGGVAVAALSRLKAI